MPTLSDYYDDLQVWENVSRQTLIAEWPVDLASSVEAEIHDALGTARILGMRCPIRKGSTNQSIGNQVEDSVIPVLATRLVSFTLKKCAGAGYPDWEMLQTGSGIKMPFEVKATAGWNPNDSSRRVLTSSSDKLRTQFSAPIHHLLFSILYEMSSPMSARIGNIRLDFLEPATLVGVRLEASVSHKILCTGSHRSIVF